MNILPHVTILSVVVEDVGIFFNIVPLDDSEEQCFGVRLDSVITIGDTVLCLLSFFLFSFSVFCFLYTNENDLCLG